LALPAAASTPFAALAAAHSGLERFLARSLPHFVECLLRRDVRPGEAPHVQRFLALVLCLGVRSIPHDIEPLLALLCLLLGAPLSYGFSLEWAPPGYAFAPEGFYQMHGRPLYRRWVWLSAAIFFTICAQVGTDRFIGSTHHSAGGRALYAWPDEMEAAVPEEELARGEAAIGRPVDVRLEVRWP